MRREKKSCIAFRRGKNILPARLLGKKILLTRNHPHPSPPPSRVKWSVPYYSFFEAFLANSSTHARARYRQQYHASVKRKPNKNHKHGARQKNFPLYFPCQYFQESKMFLKFIESRYEVPAWEP